MALPGSGTITWDMIRAEFGGGYPIYISDYYRGGPRVPNTPANAGVPTSGTLYASQFYNATNYTPVSAGGGSTNLYNSRTGAGTVTVSALASGSGGTGSYTYSWTRLSGVTTININNASVANPQFSTSFINTNASRNNVWRCTVSDGTTSATRDYSITLEVFRSGGGVIP